MLVKIVQISCLYVNRNVRRQEVFYWCLNNINDCTQNLLKTYFWLKSGKVSTFDIRLIFINNTFTTWSCHCYFFFTQSCIKVKVEFYSYLIVGNLYSHQSQNRRGIVEAEIFLSAVLQHQRLSFTEVHQLRRGVHRKHLALRKLWETKHEIKLGC